jgi:SAM-dependent methyltransferase/acyl carrier protein
VDTLIGHSFGQLTALCIADSISQKDSLRLISGRARLVQENWGKELGLMITVECDREDIEAVVDQVNSQVGFLVNIACFNGTRSFVLAGDISSIEKVEEACRSPESAARFKVVRLRNSHAYHSYLADAILPGLEKLTKLIEIREPRIPVETCSKGGTWLQFTAKEVVQHTRQPVYFSDAVERIAERFRSAIWLGGVSIIGMTRRVLSTRLDSDDTFVHLELGPRDASKSLANAASQLWVAGTPGHYWLFHASQRSEYTRLDVPSYQFEKAKHWIQYKPAIEVKSNELAQSSNTRGFKLVSLVKHDVVGEFLFSVDTSNAGFDFAARGHAVAGQSLCPASMYIELAARCATAVSGDISGYLPQVEELTMSAPLGLSVDVTVLLRLRETVKGMWSFTVLSQSLRGYGDTEHGKGRISLVPADDSSSAIRMKLLKQLARSSRCDQILASPLATGITGPMVYKVFSDVVEYATYYRGVKSLFGLDNEVVGSVVVPGNLPFGMDPGVCDPITLDNFLQVAGIHVNCLSERRGGEVFMCTGVSEVVPSQTFMENRSNTRSWIVYSKYETLSRTNIINDIFVYDSNSKSLVLTMLGVMFRSVPFESVVKSLARLNNVNGSARKVETTNDPDDSGYQLVMPSPKPEEDCWPNGIKDNLTELSEPIQPRPVGGSANSSQTVQKVREMLSEIMEIPINEIVLASKMEELGIDSLLATEVIGEIKKQFDVEITSEEFQELDDILSLCRKIRSDSVMSSQKPAKEVATPYKNETVPVNRSGSKSQNITNHDDRAESNFTVVSQNSFLKVRNSYDEHASNTGFANFCTEAFPLQSALVVQYVVDAFAALGCDLAAIETSDEVPKIQHIAKHDKLIPQLYKILQTAGLITKENGNFCRTAMIAPGFSASALHATMLEKFPKHTSETNLLHTTGHRLADCLYGAADPLALIFRDVTARALLEDVYTNAPMFKAGTMLLAQHLSEVLEGVGGSRELKILELGAGTGGTTKYLVERLANSKHKFSYTFTDLSSSLVMAAKRKFAKYSFMEYTVLDIEKDPKTQFISTFDIIISTNCIHATKDLILSTTNIRKMLRPDGMLCLVELTRNLFWFDLVFGLLEGWWLFSDGREHVLADENRWERCLHAAGFQWVDWSDSLSEESDILRFIVASPSKVIPSSETTVSSQQAQETETLVFKEVDGLKLSADIYYPLQRSDPIKKLPVGEITDPTAEVPSDVIHSSHDPRRWKYHAVTQ